MKTSIKNLFAASLTVITLTTSAFATTGTTEKNLTVLDQKKNISKIVVSGNVELIVLQSATQQVKIYDNYYSKNALVQEENGVLRISSFQKEKLTVAVYVSNLSSIEAGDQSVVRTLGKVNFLDLNVVLKDEAKAEINSNTVSLTTTVKDNATIKLSGQTVDYNALVSVKAKINMDQFKAESSSLKSNNPVIAKVQIAKKKLNDFSEVSDIDELAK